MSRRRMLLFAALAPLPLMPILAPAARGEGVVTFVGQPRSVSIGGEAGSFGHRIGNLPVRTLRVAGDPAAAARLLARIPGIRWAEPDMPVRVLGVDPKRSEQWALDAISAERGWFGAGIASLPSITGTPIAVIDTGAATAHEDLRGRIIACAASTEARIREGGCADRDGHGTHVAGIAAAATGNAIGVAGVGASSPLMICRALGPAGSGGAADVAACVSWASRRGAKVISMSLGGPPSRPLRIAIQSAWSGGRRDGAILVAAAGNDGPGEVSYPAGWPEVVSVAATDRNGRRAPFSDTNRDVEIAAPGVGILSLAARGGYRLMSGTSMATPHVAGAAALLWQSAPGQTAAAVRKRLDHSVRDAGSRGRDSSFGFGVLDLSR